MLKNFSLLLLSLVSIVACANNPFSSYKTTADHRLYQVYQGNLALAMESEAKPDLLYRMEYGSLLRLANQYESSASQFNLAYDFMVAWVDQWKNTSQGQISDSLVANLLNDNAINYSGKDYEKVFLSTFSALDYFNLKNYDYARVNVKRVGQTEQALKNYNQVLYTAALSENASNRKAVGGNYLTNQLSSSAYAQQFYTQVSSPEVLALKNSYQNAFSNYVAGYIYQALNDASEARAGYINALQLNPANQLIQTTIQDLDSAKKPAKGYSDVLIIEEAGHAAQIKSQEFSLPFNAKLFNKNNGNSGQTNACINSINIFFPRIIPDNINTRNYGFNLDQQSYPTYLMADTNLMLARYLHDQIPHIIARNITAGLRNIASSQAACSAGGNLGAILSLATSVGGAMLDRADERTWTMLPGKIYINRLKLAYGSHTLSVNVNGRLQQQTITINQPYSILSYRVMGDRVYFTN